MADIAITTYVTPSFKIHCGAVYCSESFVSFSIKCKKCSDEFNLLCYTSFVKHIKECMFMEEIHIESEIEIIPNDGIEKPHTSKVNDLPADCTDPLNLNPVKEEMYTQIEVYKKSESTEDCIIDDCQSDYEDKDGLTISKIVRRNVIEEIIAEYKKRPLLWDQNLQNSITALERTYLFGEITEAVNAKFHKNLSNSEVRRQISDLRVGYKRVAKKLEELQTSPRLWYFKLIAFIDQSSNATFKTNSTTTKQQTENKSEGELSDSNDAAESKLPVVCRKLKTQSQLHERNITSDIIDEYKKYRFLWDSKLPEYKDIRKRRNGYNKIAKFIQKKYKTDVNGDDINRRICSLRSSHRGQTNRKNAGPVTLWYYNKLMFVFDQESKEATEQALGNSKSNSNNSNADSIENQGTSTSRKKGNILKTETDVIALIDLYKASPVIWDYNHSEHISVNARKKAYTDLCSNLHDVLDYTLSLDEVRHQIRYLRREYFRALLNKSAFQKGNTKVKLSQPFFYNQISFLEPFAPKKSVLPILLDVKPDPTEDFTFLIENKPLMTKFIDLYAEERCLWDQNHEDANNPSAQSNAYEKLINMFSQNQVLLNKQQVMSAIILLHATVVSTQSAFENNQQEEPIWFYEKLKFLAKTPQKTSKICLHCNQQFHTKYELKQHKIQIGEYPYRCLVCGKGFTAHAKYVYHRSTHKEPFKCDLCEFQSRDKKNFQVHMFRHKGIAPFPCDQCDKKFVTSSELKEHIRTHTGERPFICEICGKNMVSHSEYYQHRKKHRNQRDYKCNLCGNAFFTPHTLRNHMATHSDERNHVCLTCGAAFKTMKTLRQHQALHADQKKHECKICGKLFAQKAGVYAHMKSHDLLA